MRKLNAILKAHPAVGVTCVLLVGYLVAEVAAQQMKLTDGTFANKVVVYTLDGTAAGGGDASAANQTTQIGHLAAIESATEGAATSLDNIEANLSSDAVHGNAVIATGPQGMAEFNSAPSAVSSGQTVRLQASSKGELLGVIRDAAGNGRGANVNASNQLAIAGPVTNAGTFATQVDGAALTALQLIDDDQTGASVNYKTSAGTTEDETEIKATAGRLFSITATNTNAAVRYLRCANLTAANTTPGSSTVFVGIAIPGATTGAGITATFGGPSGVAFSTALTCWAVTGAADTDVAEVAANEIKWIIAYK